jgi:hypothetical protein
MWDSLFCIIFLFDLDQDMLNGLYLGGMMRLAYAQARPKKVLILAWPGGDHVRLWFGLAHLAWSSCQI